MTADSDDIGPAPAEFVTFYRNTVERTFRIAYRMARADQEVARTATQDAYRWVLRGWEVNRLLGTEEKTRYVTGLAVRAVVDTDPEPDETEPGGRVPAGAEMDDVLVDRIGPAGTELPGPPERPAPAGTVPATAIPGRSRNEPAPDTGRTAGAPAPLPTLPDEHPGSPAAAPPESVRELIDRQPAIRRAVAILFFVEEYPPEEIAGVLDVAESTILGHLERMRVLMKPLVDGG